MTYFFKSKYTKYYSKFANSNVNSMYNLINFNNSVHKTFLNYFVFSRTLNLLKSFRGFAIASSSEINNKDAANISKISINEIIKSILTPGNNMLLINMIMSQRLTVQWNGLDMQSISSSTCEVNLKNK